MRGIAHADMIDAGELWRNDGYGWEKLLDTKSSIRFRLNQPAPDDPVDASAAQVEFIEVHLPWNSPVRIGDQYHQDDLSWAIGLANKKDTYQTFVRCYATRPIAATALEWITPRRWNGTAWVLLAPQLVQIAWNKNQPDRLGGVAVRQYGHILAPEGSPDLDIEQGDTFYFYGLNANVTWVIPDPGQRREALFSTNVGEGV
jgi:hypothetical protein